MNQIVQFYHKMWHGVEHILNLSRGKMWPATKQTLYFLTPKGISNNRQEYFSDPQGISNNHREYIFS